MTFINDDDRARIRAAIEAAERRTSGELVTVVAPMADDYLYIPVLWAALVALLLPGVLLLAGQFLPMGDVYLLQLGLFVVAALLFRWPPLLIRLIPRAVRVARARRLAREQFFQQGLYRTTGGTGVLLFVSVAEHYVEIIADRGIDSAVPDGFWQTVVDDLTGALRAGRVGDGFVAAIEACGGLLAARFPAPADDRNELQDHLIEL